MPACASGRQLRHRGRRQPIPKDGYRHGLGKMNTDSGVGLAGMRERINDLNGQFEIESSKGTTVRVRIPLVSPAQAEDSNRSLSAA
jgi:glucose-6-phosphate-specific signal transduction histidine kinase